jgi:hypothetical protein
MILKLLSTSVKRGKWEQSCLGVGTDSQRRIQVQKLCVLCENSNSVLTRCAPGGRVGAAGTPQDCGGCTRGSTWLSATGPCAISRSLHWSTMRLPRRQRQQISHKLSTWRHAQTAYALCVCDRTQARRVHFSFCHSEEVMIDRQTHEQADTALVRYPPPNQITLCKNTANMFESIFKLLCLSHR